MKYLKTAETADVVVFVETTTALAVVYAETAAALAVVFAETAAALVGTLVKGLFVMAAVQTALTVEMHWGGMS